jgi:hypothetical protein
VRVTLRRVLSRIHSESLPVIRYHRDYDEACRVADIARFAARNDDSLVECCSTPNEERAARLGRWSLCGCSRSVPPQ